MADHTVKVGAFQLRFEDLELPMGLAVAKVDVDGPGAVIAAHPFSLDLVSPGTMVAEVAQEALSDFLEAQSPAGLKEFDVRADGGKLHVKAKKTVLVDLKVTATASLRIVDGRQLWVDVESVDVMGAGAKNLVASQLAKINPVLDAADLPIEATLTSVEVGDGKVVLRGTVAPK